MSLNENVADNTSSNFHHGLNTTITGLRNESPAVEQNGSIGISHHSHQLQPLPALEDCVCPICLEYFIDIVQTRCQHRFCKFCLENWFLISLHRRCPTCRREVESFYRLPQLQKSICRVIQPELSEEAFQERNTLRLARQALLDRANREREQTQALLGRITNNRLQRGQNGESNGNNNEVATVQSGNLISSHIINWWDDNRLDLHERLRELIRPTPASNEVSIEDVPRVWRRFRRQYPEATGRGTNEEYHNRDRSRDPPSTFRTAARNPTATPTPTTPVLGGLTDDSFNETYIRLASEYENLQYQQNLMEEYNYHMQRLISSYTKIREGYRDFNYHNSRMQQLTDEYQSFFDRTASNGDAPENNVDYEDFEDMAEAELNEFIDGLPIGRGRGRALREGSLDGLYFNGLPRLQRGTLESFSGVEAHIREVRSRLNTLGTQNGQTFTEAARPYNSAGMEQNIETRRSQFDVMSRRLRRLSRNRTLISPRPIRVAARNMSSTGPVPLPMPDIPLRRRENRPARSTSVHYAETEASRAIDAVPVRDVIDTNRQLRRRPHDLNHVTRIASDEERIRRIARRFIRADGDNVTNQPAILSSNLGSALSSDQNNLQSNGFENGDNRPTTAIPLLIPQCPASTEENANVMPIPIRPVITSISRPLMLPRRRMVIVTNSSSGSEDEQSRIGNLINQAPVRPISAPEDRSNRNSVRIFHRTGNSNFCGSGLAVSSTPASNTNLTDLSNQESRPRPATTMGHCNSTEVARNGEPVDDVGPTSEASSVQITSPNDEARGASATQNISSLSKRVEEIFQRSTENFPSERER
ncbi:unnamed protein product [Orchesella dallaii]|uniref:RING-type domain-containing protein n=1 Tax=Orchesella dallaii TaxID=48710 RepID=A0ABP1RN91_9HEXA